MVPNNTTCALRFDPSSLENTTSILEIGPSSMINTNDHPTFGPSFSRRNWASYLWFDWKHHDLRLGQTTWPYYLPLLLYCVILYYMITTLLTRNKFLVRPFFTPHHLWSPCFGQDVPTLLFDLRSHRCGIPILPKPLPHKWRVQDLGPTPKWPKLSHFFLGAIIFSWRAWAILHYYLLELGPRLWPMHLYLAT